MEKTLSSIIGWLLLPVYWLKYPNTNIGGGCLIDIFSVKLGKKVKIGSNCRLGPNVDIDDYSILGHDSIISNVSIGKFCTLGPDFNILPYGHNYEWFSTYPICLLADNKYYKVLLNKQKVYYGLTIIKNDVWAGARSTVMGGSVIENGVVVGTHALVRGHLKNFGIYAGIPAKFIKFRFSQKKIREYINISWYDKPIKEIISMALKS